MKPILPTSSPFKSSLSSSNTGQQQQQQQQQRNHNNTNKRKADSTVVAFDGTSNNSNNNSSRKVMRTTATTTATAVAVQQQQQQPIPIVVPSTTTTLATGVVDHNSIRERFLHIFTMEPYIQSGIRNSILKQQFFPNEQEYVALAPIINDLIRQSRLTMSKISTMNTNSNNNNNNTATELVYQLVSQEMTSKFVGLDTASRMVYQMIESSGNHGIWTKDIRIQTNIQQQVLTKILKGLENRLLIKPVKSVLAKSKKLYMLYNLQPSTELTGGIWYSEYEFDYEFIYKLRIFVLQCIKKLCHGTGVTIHDIMEKITASQISRVPLSKQHIQQILNTLLYDYMIETIHNNNNGNTNKNRGEDIQYSDVNNNNDIVDETNDTTDNDDVIYIISKKVTPFPCCDYNWWEVLDNDFQYRNIVFEDHITLSAHEYHYHT